jgi:tellurium resistance protein TerZ
MGVNLSKGERISLTKQQAGTLAVVMMGLGWDAKQKKRGFLGLGGGEKEIDLDASCILFDHNKKVVDVVWFRQLQSKDGSIIHTGDNRTGQGSGDDEQIIVDLVKVPEHVKSLVFVVNSFTGQDFSQIENAFCRLVDQKTDQEVARYDLSCQGQHTAQIMVKIYRHEDEWKMHAIGENASGRTFDALVPSITPYI